MEYKYIIFRVEKIKVGIAKYINMGILQGILDSIC